MRLQRIDLRRGGSPPPPERPALDPDVVRTAREIVERVRRGGDRALVELASELDGADLSAGRLVATREELAGAADRVAREVRDAIDAMIERLRDLHARQVPREWEAERNGLRYGEVVRPLRRVGCYVPGGRAAYPSTVAMTVVPARVAGVEEVVVCSPARADGTLPDEVLYAAERAGASLVVKAGGAQAVAAMAYGTESVPAVDLVVGPGNVFVTAAKREVAGDVGIDGLAGPTELVVVADRDADPGLLAADLVAQAEHDPLALTTLVTDHEDLLGRVEAALDEAVGTAPRREIVEGALSRARAVVVRDAEQAVAVANDLAPEHLQLVVADPHALLPAVRRAGAVFLGRWTPVPLGDYGAGSNHVLPTMGTARFASGLRAADFVTVSSFVEASPAAVARLGPEVAALARAEGLEGHAVAVEARVARQDERARA